MVFQPQKTNFQIKIIENLDTLSSWAKNPWRRYSFALIILYWLLRSSLGMVSGS